MAFCQRTLFPVPDDRVELLVGGEGEVATERDGVEFGDGRGRRRRRRRRPVRTEIRNQAPSSKLILIWFRVNKQRYLILILFLKELNA